MVFWWWRLTWLILNLHGCSRILAVCSLPAFLRLFGLDISQWFLSLAATWRHILLVEAIRTDLPWQEELPLALFVFQKIDALRLIIAPFFKFRLVRAQLLSFNKMMCKFLDFCIVVLLRTYWRRKCLSVIHVENCLLLCCLRLQGQAAQKVVCPLPILHDQIKTIGTLLASWRAFQVAEGLDSLGRLGWLRSAYKVQIVDDVMIRCCRTRSR